MINWGIIGHIILGVILADMIGGLIQLLLIKILKGAVKKKYLTKVKVGVLNKEEC